MNACAVRQDGVGEEFLSLKASSKHKDGPLQAAIQPTSRRHSNCQKGCGGAHAATLGLAGCRVLAGSVG